MLNGCHLILAVCLSAGVLIGPSAAATPVLLAPDVAIVTTGSDGASQARDDAPRLVVRARIDATRYATAPVDARDRTRPMWLAIVATLTLGLGALAPRRATTIVLAVAIAWSIGLIVLLARRPAFDRIADGDVDWLIARRSGIARVPINDGVAWVPIVESMRHWHALAPRVVVDAEGRPTLELTLPGVGARVAVERRTR